MPSGAFPVSLRQLGELGLLEQVRRWVGQHEAPVYRSIGEDAAAVRIGSDRLLLLTTDLLVERIHFDLATTAMKDIGYKAAVGNLSDIAAMGGKPEYMLLALAVPATFTSSKVHQLYQGLLQACRPHRVKLVGGDTAASPIGLFVCITVTGTSSPRHLLTRDGARAGDLVYVTGTLGDSLAGLTILKSQWRTRRPTRGAGKGYLRFLVRRHLRPAARIREGAFLATRRLATAAMDLSDGLSGDLGRLCEQSSVGAEVEAALLPLSPACRWYASTRAVDPARFALQGGEDYELLFTVPPRNRARLDQLARRAGFRLTCIGKIRPKNFGICVKPANGPLHPLVSTSYEHFSPKPGLTRNRRRA